MYENEDYMARCKASIINLHIQLSHLYCSLISNLEQQPLLERDILTLEYEISFATRLQKVYFELKEKLVIEQLPKETQQVCLNGEWQNLTDLTESE